MKRIAIFVGLWGCACNKNDDGDQTDTDTDVTTTDPECDASIETTFTESDVAGVGTVTFTGASGDTWVEHRLADADTWIAGPVVDGAAGEVGVWGLRVGSDHKIRIQTDGGTRASCAIDVETGPPAEGTPAFIPFYPENWVPDKACEGADSGYVLLSWLGSGDRNGVAIIDREGKYVWALSNDGEMPWGAADTLVGRVRPGRDGKSLVWNTAHTARKDDLAEIIRISMDGKEVTRTRTLNGHHDFVELPDGTMSWLGYDFRTMDVEGIGTELPVAADVIYEAPEGATTDTTPTTVYNMFDDYPYGIYDSGSEMEQYPRGFLPDYHEFSHANSIAYLPGSDTYLVGFRWLDTMIKIQRDGTWLWQWGNQHPGGVPPTDFTGDDSTLPNHAHFSDVWESGLPDSPKTHLVLMDNHDIDRPSRLAGFDLDETAMTFERGFFYQSDKFESLLGDIRRMPIEGCDNYLVAFSSQGRVTEMTPEGEIVWDMAYSQIGTIVARVHFLPSLVDFGDYAYWNPEL